MENHEFYIANRTKPYGIDEFYNLSNAEEEAEKIREVRKLLRERSSVKYLGLTAYALINRDSKVFYDDLISFLDSGKEICILILSPNSEEKAFRDKIHENSSNYDFSHLAELQLKYGDQVRVRVTDL